MAAGAKLNSAIERCVIVHVVGVVDVDVIGLQPSQGLFGAAGDRFW